jgi:hypothetical protein
MLDKSLQRLFGFGASAGPSIRKAG